VKTLRDINSVMTDSYSYSDDLNRVLDHEIKNSDSSIKKLTSTTEEWEGTEAIRYEFEKIMNIEKIMGTTKLIIVRHGNTFSKGETPTRVGAKTDLD